jgi:hypothetical protein
MKAKLILMRTLIGLGGLLLAATPSLASAHDNLGGDELVVANWMLVGAFAVIVMGVLAGIWAAKAGQFTNVEESKFRMIDNAEDYDAIMAEADAQERAAHQAREAANRARETEAAASGSRGLKRELEDQHVVP